MAVTPSEFLVDFPEFVALHSEDAPLIVAALASAERRFGDAIPTAVRDDFVKLRAAVTLANGPWGRNARLSDPKGECQYSKDLKERMRGFAFARSRIV